MPAEAATGVPPPQAPRAAFVAAPPTEAPPPETPEPDRSPASSGGRGAWLWVLVAALLIGGGVAAYLLTRPKQVMVPIVVNEQQSLAIAKVTNAGLTPSVITEPNTDPPGTVVSQDPLGRAQADQGSTVRIVVSSGPGNASVPPVVEMSKPAAEKLIKKDGLTVGSTPTAYSATVAVGDIVRTDPGAGTSVPVGSDVTLFVSSGPAPVKVPSVVGDTESAAKSALAPLNVTITTSQQPSSQTPGTVTSQSMTGSVPAGSTINLVIAEAPPMVKVPTVTGDTAAAASKALKAAGFSVTQTSMTVTDQTEDGTVISQTPNAGRQAKKGATVTIVVGKFTAPTQTTSTPTTTTTTPTTTT